MNLDNIFSLETIKAVGYAMALVGAIASAFFWLGFLVYLSIKLPAWLISVVKQQFVAAFGIPFAAIVSFCLVLFLEAATGDIEFTGLGFEFKGASGPVVLWVFAFLAIVVALKVLVVKNPGEFIPPEH